MGIEATAVALTGSDQIVRTGITNYRGFAIRETAGAIATVRVYDGTDATGLLIDDVGLAAAGSAREWYGPDGIRCATGLFVKIVAGTVEGSVRLG